MPRENVIAVAQACLRRGMANSPDGADYLEFISPNDGGKVSGNLECLNGTNAALEARSAVVSQPELAFKPVNPFRFLILPSRQWLGQSHGTAGVLHELLAVPEVALANATSKQIIKSTRELRVGGVGATVDAPPFTFLQWITSCRSSSPPATSHLRWGGGRGAGTPPPIHTPPLNAAPSDAQARPLAPYSEPVYAQHTPPTTLPPPPPPQVLQRLGRCAGAVGSCEISIGTFLTWKYHYSPPLNSQGAPGVLGCLTLAANVYAEDDAAAAERYTASASLAADCVWERGLVTKGLMLCHGISGA